MPAHLEEGAARKSLELPYTFRPPILTATIFVLLSIPAAVIFGFVFHTAPLPVRMFVGFLVLAWLCCSIRLAFSKVHVDESGITGRHFLTWTAKWIDIHSWSAWGAGNTIAIRLQDGRTKIPSSWCVYGERNDALATVLERFVGPRSKGGDAVMPKPLQRIMKPILDSRTKD